METFITNTVNLILNTYTDLSSFGTLRIYYKKPSGATGYWTSTAVVGDTNKMEKQLTITDLDENGVWLVQAFAQQGISKYHGKWATISVYMPITTEPPTTAPPTTAAP